MNPHTLPPIPPRDTPYAIPPAALRDRCADLPYMTSVGIKELFADAPDAISLASPEIIRAQVKRDTLKALEDVDLSMIRPGDSVNILASHHGFMIYGGTAYAEMLATIRDEVERRCGTQDIFLRLGSGLRAREGDQLIKTHGLDKRFHKKASGMAPMDPGVPIETEIGTFYGVKSAYSARWIIHAHNSDLRELHYHRYLGRLLKPFAMSYATAETRSTFHQCMGPRAANLVQRIIYQSPFVQEKFAASVILKVAPTGIAGVDASNDLLLQDKKLTKQSLIWFGKMATLLSRIEDVVAVIDYPNSIPYTTAGGILFCNFINANVDEFDLDTAFTPFSRYMDMLYDGDDVLFDRALVPPPNPAIRALVVNYCLRGYPGTFFAQQLPTMVVGPQAELLRNCVQNATFMDSALEVENLKKGVDFARKVTGSENILAFDGAVGGLNVSCALAEQLRAMAPAIAEEVDGVLLPKWLAQRGLT